MWIFEFLLSNADFMHFFNKLINSFSLVLDSAVFESISRFIKSIFDTFIPTAMCDADINPNKKEAKHADGVTFEDVFLFLWVMSVFMCLVRRDPDFDSGIDVTASSPTFSLVLVLVLLSLNSVTLYIILGILFYVLIIRILFGNLILILLIFTLL